MTQREEIDHLTKQLSQNYQVSTNHLRAIWELDRRIAQGKTRLLALLLDEEQKSVDLPS